MHFLDRSTIQAPSCLTKYQHGGDRWDDVTPQDKDEIRCCLEKLQEGRCAYCEGSLDELKRHIEHFRTRHHFPTLTFAWDNLFWSCDGADSCGKHKDNHATPYNPADLIDPSRDNPDDFFQFLSNGTIEVRPESSPAKQRAAETLRILNLNTNRLKNMRSRAVQGYLDTNHGILEVLEQFSPTERDECICDELKSVEHDPFFTTIRHFFQTF